MRGGEGSGGEEEVCVEVQCTGGTVCSTRCWAKQKRGSGPS